MRALVSDDIGLLKDVEFASNETRLVWNESNANHIVSLAVAVQSPFIVIASRVDGTLESLELSCTEKAWVSKNRLDLDEPALEIAVVAHGLVHVLTESSLYSVHLDVNNMRIEKTYTLPGGPYSVVRFLKSSDSKRIPRVLAAADQHPPVVIDLVNGQIIWQGKNAVNTPLGLTSIFETESLISLSDNVFATSDTTGKLRFYDISQQKKPILEFPVYQAFNVTNNYTGTSGMGQTRPIKKLEITIDGSTLLTGDTHGSVLGLDISKIKKDNGIKIPVPSEDAKIGTKAHLEFCRKLFPMRFSLPGIMGAIRSIAVTETTVYVATAGRYAYAFDIKSKGKKFHKVFMKQKLTCCLPIDSSILNEGKEDDGEENPSEDDDLIQEILESVEKKDDGEYMSKSKRRRMRKGASKQ